MATTEKKRRVWQKACPKCRGDLYKQSYLGTEEEYTCLQCGLTLDKQRAQELLGRLAA